MVINAVICYEKVDFSYVPIYLAAISTLTGIFTIKFLVKRELLILTVLILNVVVDSFAKYCSIQGKNTVIFYNLLTPFEIILILFTYFWYLPIGIIRSWILWCLMLFIIFSIFNSIFLQKPLIEFASFTFFLGGFLVSLFSYFLWRHEVETNIISASNVMLWFAGANFLYYSVAVPVMSANSWLVQYSGNRALPVHGINLFMYGLWALIIGVGFLWKNKQIK